VRKRKPHAAGVKSAAKKAALLFKRELKKHIKERLLTKKEAHALVSGVLAELRAERKRIVSFAKKEMRRELKKAKPIAKKALKRVRR
jgi:hypothetical protein